MKKQYILLTLLVLTITTLQAQNDSIYFWKSGALLEKRSIKTADLDSITFKQPTPAIASVTICTQTWMLKNLDVTTYSDGTPIPQVTNQTAWQNLTTGAWCYYENDPAKGAIYGKLYNWYAAAGIYDAASAANPALRKKLAPTGWHVPTDADWTTLYICVGGESVAGGKMKETGTAHWQSPNTDATNSTGFTGLPGGFRNNNGTFVNIRKVGEWWSSSEFSTADAWYHYIWNQFTDASHDYGNKTKGSSVRCLRD
ncbi:MAG: hypothetical protein CFE24_05425 [Flavobacterium sp. BFFFF2]|nr:MAG: hypothetical protein CFE24_05425 [Flavobacterium sp. BFFFF2]